MPPDYWKIGKKQHFIWSNLMVFIVLFFLSFPLFSFFFFFSFSLGATAPQPPSYDAPVVWWEDQKWRKVCCTEVICKFVREFCIVPYAVRNFEPVKWFEMRSNVMEFWSFCDSTSSRVENELKPIELLTTVTLFISTSVIKNSIGFNSFSTLLLVLSQKLQNSITSLLISNHFTGSKLCNAYNTKFFH